MFEYLSPYLDMFLPLIGKSKPIAHHQTCPACGRQLVNLYRHNGVWKCKKCWDAEEGAEIKKEELKNAAQELYHRCACKQDGE